MELGFNFILNPSGTLSQSCIALGYTDFISICNFVKQLPYGRNTNRSDFNLVLQENKGTCATKHAFLKQVAIEYDAKNIKLYLGIYKMNANNTDSVGKVLAKNNLNYIPEAHTYLKYNGIIFDFTRKETTANDFQNDLLFEEEILPKQIGNYKVELHKNFIKKWIASENIPYTFNEAWHIREACIAALSE